MKIILHCLDFGKETGLSYYPDIKKDFIHVVDEKKKFQARRGILLKNGVSYISIGK